MRPQSFLKPVDSADSFGDRALSHSFIRIHLSISHSENIHAGCTVCSQLEDRAFASCCVLGLSFLLCVEGLDGIDLSIHFCPFCGKSQR